MQIFFFISGHLLLNYQHHYDMIKDRLILHIQRLRGLLKKQLQCSNQSTESTGKLLSKLVI